MYTYGITLPQPTIAVYLAGHLVAILLDNKLLISPTVRDRQWCRPSTQRLQMDHDRLHSHIEPVVNT